MLFPFGRKVIFVVLPRATDHPSAALPLTDGAYSLRVKPLESGCGGKEQRTGRAQLAPTYKGRVQRGLLLTRTSSLDRTGKGGVEATKFL